MQRVGDDLSDDAAAGAGQPVHRCARHVHPHLAINRGAPNMKKSKAVDSLIDLGQIPNAYIAWAVLGSAQQQEWAAYLVETSPVKRR